MREVRTPTTLSQFKEKMKDITLRVPDDMAGLVEMWAERIPEMEILSICEAGTPCYGNMAERLSYAINQLREENLLPNLYDFAWLKVAMDSLDDFPNFKSAQSYLDYLYIEVRVKELPSESSISKKMNTPCGKIFEWTFSDTNDKEEITRRNNIVKRFYNLMRGGK